MTKIMKASEFKAKCLAVMDEVAESGQGVVVTKNGKPLVELVPHKKRRNETSSACSKAIWSSRETSFPPSTSCNRGTAPDG